MTKSLQPVIFYDSGVGGLPYLQWAQNNLPENSFIYLADHARLPYGDKTKNEIEKIVDRMVSLLIDNFNPSVIVVACNSATVSTIDFLRKRHSIPFIGVVPAVKPAAKISQKRKIGVMATSRTVSARYLNRLIDDFASDCEIIRIAAGEVVDFVENKLYTTTQKEKTDFLKPILSPAIEADVDVLVLGCTHFIHLKQEIESVLGNRVAVIDSVEGVGRRLEKVLSEQKLLSDNGYSNTDHPKSLFYYTEKPEASSETQLERAGIYKEFADRFNLSFEGILSENPRINKSKEVIF